MKFECSCCGGCCRGFRCLPAYEWEIEGIKKSAVEKEIKLDIKPDWKNTFLDEVSGKAVCIIYGIYNNPCGFLKNGKCINYDGRLLICRQFPISSTPFFNLISPGSFWGSSFFECKCFDCKKNFEEFFGKKFNDVVSKKEIEDYLIENYGEPYFYAKHVGIINETIKNLIEKYSREEEVKFVKVEEEDLGKYEVVPFFDYLVTRNLISEEEREKLFEKFRKVEVV